MPGPAVWIEAHHYGRRVIARNVEPWLKPAQLGLFYRQLADLLRPRLIETSLLPLMRTSIADTPSDVSDPHEAAATISDMLGAHAFSASLREGLTAIAGAGLRCDLALSLPGPHTLVYELAPHAVAGIDDDVLDTLATALTDVVRNFAGIVPARLMLHENSEAALDVCDVLLNLARDYRMPVTLISDCPVSLAGVESVMPATATAVAWSASLGSHVLTDRLWEAPDDVDGAAWRDAAIVRLVVPQRAAPEIVMKALARLTASQ